jgi:hypothetical protein
MLYFGIPAASTEIITARILYALLAIQIHSAGGASFYRQFHNAAWYRALVDLNTDAGLLSIVESSGLVAKRPKAGWDCQPALGRSSDQTDSDIAIGVGPRPTTFQFNRVTG